MAGDVQRYAFGCVLCVCLSPLRRSQCLRTCAASLKLPCILMAEVPVAWWPAQLLLLMGALKAAVRLL